MGVRQTACAEHGQFLSADKGVKSVYCRNTRLNKFVGVIARVGVYRLTVDVHTHVGNDGCAAVDRFAHTVEYAPEHVFGHGKFQAVTEETRLGGADFQPLRALKQLHQRFVAVYFQHFALADFAVFLLDFHKFVVTYAVDVVDKHQGADHFSDCFVFLYHCADSPLRELISFLMLR